MKKFFAALPLILANFVGPYVVFQALDSRYGDTFALIASAMPPLLWSFYELIKIRRLDAISVVVVGSILATLGATAIGGSPRLIQIRDALVTGAVGLMFLGSLPLQKPMIFYLARATMARNTIEGADSYDKLWDIPGVPDVFRTLTWVWGLGLVVQTATMCGLAWFWPIGRYLLFGPIIGYGIFALLMAWSLAYIAKRPQAHAIIAQR